MEIMIKIPGKPIAKKRPRFFRRGKGVGTYNEQQTEEGRFMLEAQKQLAKYNMPIAKGIPITLGCIFFFERPKSHYRTGANSIEWKHSAPIHHTQKPDLDNLIKFVKDCLNGIAWVDDCQVTNFANGTGKEWFNENCTIITIKYDKQ